MRLWHKDLISVLPRQQLLSQWRECCCIARNIAVNGTPNHILVNKLMNYDIKHFYHYARLVQLEMSNRGYKCDISKFIRWTNDELNFCLFYNNEDLFKGWHNERYLAQCMFNLQEKYDCGGITYDEWSLIQEKIGGVVICIKVD